MVRDEEIKRLIKYAEGLGTSVKILKAKKDTPSADWTLDGSEIRVYTEEKTPKIEVVLSLIHEISHHLEHIHNNDRKIDLELLQALGEDEKKKHRKKILDFEIQGTKWWETVYKEVNLSFPKWKLYASMEFDLYQYEYYYENGVFPLSHERRKKLAEINKKHKNKKYD